MSASHKTSSLFHNISYFELIFLHSPSCLLLPSSPVTQSVSSFFNLRPHEEQDIYSRFMPYVGVDLNMLQFVLRCLGDFGRIGHFFASCQDASVLPRQSRNARTTQLPGPVNMWSPSISKAAIRKQQEPKQCSLCPTSSLHLFSFPHSITGVQDSKFPSTGSSLGFDRS